MSIELKNVTHIYMPETPYEQIALKNVSLTVTRGEFVGVIGHTGSGKSTLIQHFNGLLKPTAGSVLLEGIDIHQKTPEALKAKRKIGMVFQYPEHQLFEETIAADIAFGPRNLGCSEEEIDARVRRAMTFVGLDYETFASRSPFSLSGGQMRRVAIAGVIALEPEYLILDEPTAGLDPRGRDELLAEVKQLYQSTGITVVLVSHNMEDVARLSNRIIVMRRGEVCLDGPPREIFSQSADILASAGVEVPHINRLLTRLAERGLAVDTRLLEIDLAAESIASAWKEECP